MYRRGGRNTTTTVPAPPLAHLAHALAAKRLQVVDVHVVLLKAFSGRNVEIARHLVDGEKALEVAALVGLLLHLFRPSLALALRHALAAVERPAFAPACWGAVVAGR